MKYLQKNTSCLLLICFMLYSPLFSQSDSQIAQSKIETALSIGPEDIRLEIVTTGGWNLFVRKKDSINSILLVETTKGSGPEDTNYTYRAAEKNDINGDEVRLLNGDILNSEYSLYSLVDSTPEPDIIFGQAFQIYIPKKLFFGFPWTRNGEVEVGMGTFVNIRAFEKAYADYTGSFEDNPYMFDFFTPPMPKEEKKPEVIIEPVLTNIYNEKAVDAFEKIANGMMLYSRGPETIVEDVMKSFNELPKDKPIDVVFAIDATGSMWDDIARLQRELIPSLTSSLEERSDVRLGLLFYRDFSDNFKFNGLPVQPVPFTENKDVFFAKLNTMKIKQGSSIGGDIPEAVYEALYAAIKYYDWRMDAKKKVILIGDAQPHETPRGIYGVGQETVKTMAEGMNITIDCIITPDK